ncbi:MAG: FAD-dependent oxidoreductase [Bdellovibrionales bacterium]|nr:FAD-dependent oxidoreductase [Bdellovibrionales bacterium]
MALRKKLVIIGSGFAGFRLFKGISSADYDVTIISRRNHFLFTPLLTSTTVGTLEFRSITEPLRDSAGKKEVLVANVCSIDFPKKQVHVNIRTTQKAIRYDTLVIAVGAKTNTFSIPGVEEHCLFLKELADARSVRQKIVDCLEQAALPEQSDEEIRRLTNFVVIGGGPTGVEFAAELHDFLTQDLKRLYPSVAQFVQITLVEASPRILGSFSGELGEYATRLFRKRNIKLLTNSFVNEVTDSHVRLSGGESIACNLKVWTAGIAPRSLLTKLGITLDSSGHIVVDEYLKVPSLEHVYAMGDCAQIDGKPLPATAQVAQQQGKYLADSLTHLAHHRTLTPFAFKNLGMLAYLGNSRALAEIGPIHWKGFTAWIFWRSVYLTKLVSIKNKVLVLFDWFKAKIFGRDVSRF